ncbi:uncharacterized protein THITE_2111648 [Thermothielavioides terrestris NRRL 8126]|uniref:Apopolysialoglycoprotein-like protein n=1 Tax=Thermothielavioides terrestris (strain ATCC 38088 / NRRL 8126) TaxID=578455 RepID=G2R358_THETT|nr:uncharacterized protein THITE_2111648 [Thermothielavioides terrestris NRRL 8126]AEO65064.1 hypothetical protein THITE_2111648 [Thermothielavioides terrestris NRRL 8126]
MQRTQQLRTATQTRRSARTGFPEPDDFEGLPVRQWRQEWVTIAPSLPQEMTQQGDRWAVELPYGMPRESHLLPPHSQELLRAARSGRLYKRPAPAEEEEGDPELDAVKGEKRDWEPPSEGYMVKIWKQVPRNAESPTISHLAKRHKNTVTLASKAAAAPLPTGPTVIRATVRRIDAAGNPYEQTVTISEGQHVDGEIISSTVVPASSAVQGELPLKQPTPSRRRPPPPKRKAKGLGRGRKKGRLPLPLPATRSQAPAADGAAPIKAEGVGSDGIKIQDIEGSVNQDSEMANTSGVPSEDEEGEGGEGEEEEDGEEEGGDDETGETSVLQSSNGDAPGQEAEDPEMSDAVHPTSAEEPDEPRAAPSEVEDVTIPKPPNIANLAPPPLAPFKLEGSPLKNVMIQSPTEPSPLVSPQAAHASFPTSSSLDVQSRTQSTELGSGDTVVETGVQDISTRPMDSAGAAGEQAAVPGVVAEILAPETSTSAPAGEASQTTAAASNGPQETAGPSQTSLPQTSEPSASSVPVTTEVADPEVVQPVDPPAALPGVSLQPPDSPALLPTAAEDEDDGLNLLGSLERELDRQEGMSNASSGSEAKATPNDHNNMAPATVEGPTAADTSAEATAPSSTDAPAAAAAPADGDRDAEAPAPAGDGDDASVQDAQV